MAYLKLSIYTETERVICSFDFTPQEFIPLVRHVTRTLAWQYEHLREPLQHYHAVIQPWFFEGSDQETETILALPSKRLDDSQHTIQVQDHLSLRRAASIASEMSAFNNPGTSRLCQNCPERCRCIGSGVSVGTDILNGWIDLVVEGKDHAKQMYQFQLLLYTLQDQCIYSRIFPITVMQSFINLVYRKYVKERGHKLIPDYQLAKAHIYVYAEGQPRLSPLLDQIRSTTNDASLLGMTDSSPSRSVIDWDQVDGLVDSETHSSDELGITIVSEEEVNDEPTQKCPPRETQYISNRPRLADDLRIYIQQPVLNDILRHARHTPYDVGGILLGDVFHALDDFGDFIEIVGVAFVNGDVGLMSLTPGHYVWSYLATEVKKSFPNKRIVGWLRSHRSLVQVLSFDDKGIRNISSDLNLELREQEYFLHQHFFPEPWQVSLIVDPSPQRTRFYHQRDELVIACSGYYIFK